MLFIMNESIKFNDYNGTNDTATYLGPVLHDDILKNKTRLSDESEYLVNRENISSITFPVIENAPILVKQYLSELHNLIPDQLKNIANTDNLDNDKRYLIVLHSKMNHLPFPAITKISKKGRINKRFAKLKYRFPVCMSCVFGMSHRRPWRSKITPGTIHKDSETEPGDCVRIDQVVSAQPDMIPQISGYLTNMKIWGVTVFVDHVTDFNHVALMRDLTLDETLLAKTSFERFENDGGVTIKLYQADGGRFEDKGFNNAVQEINKTITFYAFGDHHQNVIVEINIKEPTLIDRTLLLHTISHWYNYITTMMWPFALKEAAFCLKEFSIREDGRSK